MARGAPAVHRISVIPYPDDTTNGAIPRPVLCKPEDLVDKVTATDGLNLHLVLVLKRSLLDPHVCRVLRSSSDAGFPLSLSSGESRHSTFKQARTYS